MSDYIPERGDIIWLDFSPQLGREQRGRRPALVLSHKLYNEKTDLAVICPITSKVKGYPFEIKLPRKYKTKGVVISDQIKSLDWKYRNAEYIEKSSNDIINAILEKVKLIID
jgi:mRNA interferase MazF